MHKKNVRFPTDDEILDFLDDAIPIAKKEANKNGMSIETWMLADAICRICPEIIECDQLELGKAIERVIEHALALENCSSKGSS